MVKETGLQIDLNSDLGEHPNSNLDEQIMPFLSSCNIACGGHAGNENSVEHAVMLARQFNVAIGAHPGYPDRQNFGRTVIALSSDALAESLVGQINMVHRACKAVDRPLHHIKPHGALYNEAAKNEKLSDLICQVIKSVSPASKLYGLAHSITERVAYQHGLDFIAEGFADRRYEADKTLMSRKKEGSVLTKEADVLKQVEEMVLNRRVYANGWTSLEASTICLHSDTKGAVNLAKKIRNHLEKKRVHITAV